MSQQLKYRKLIQSLEIWEQASSLRKLGNLEI